MVGDCLLITPVQKSLTRMEVASLVTVTGRVIRHSRKYVIMVRLGESERLARLFRKLIRNRKALIMVGDIQMIVHVGVLHNNIVFYLPSELNPVWEGYHGREVTIGIAPP